MLKNKSLIFILLVVIVLAVIKWFFFTTPDVNTGPGGPSGKGGSGKPVAVNGIIITGSDLEENIFAIGTILANEEVELRPEISGKVVSILFKEGSIVQKGTLLVKLNDADLQAQLAKLQNNRLVLKANTDRQKRLLEMNGISQQEYDEAMNQLNAVESDIQFTKVQIEKTEIRAPFTGMIGLKNISEGSYVSMNFLIATMQQLDPVKIDFAIPEKYSEQIKTGQEVSYTLDGNQSIQSAKIYAIEPKVDAATRSVKVRALSANPGHKIIPGSFARVKFSLYRSGTALLIPTEAVIPILKGKKVLVAKNGKAISQNIITGIRKNKEVEVIDGLVPGDTVITSGIMQLRDSMDVTVKVFE